MDKAIGWAKKIIVLLILTFIIGFAAYSIDHAYFEYPLGKGVIGISAKDKISLPATTEISFDANGTYPIQIDLGAKSNDLEGELELLGPNDKVCFEQKFNVKKYPAGFLPNPGKWSTFYTANRGAGEYKLRITQSKPGQVITYFYQGPFVIRFLLLPFTALFFYFLYVFTFGKQKKKIVPGQESEKRKE